MISKRLNRFQPPGFEPRAIATSLGSMVYYTPKTETALSSLDRKALPTLVFLHSVGGGSSAYEWSKVYPAFVGTHQVLAPDLIGWGDSAHPVHRYQISDYWRMLLELLQQVAEPPVTVVASSLTAGMTIRLAIQRPELFQSLVLVCPTGYADFGQDYRQGIAAQLTAIAGLDHWIYALGAANQVAVRLFLQQVLFAQASRVTPEMVAAYLACAQQPNAEFAALASLRGDLCFDLACSIKHLTVPTLIFWGEQTRFTGAALGQRLADLNPDVIRRFQVIPGTGVLPHLELPEIIIGLMQRDLQPIS